MFTIYYFKLFSDNIVVSLEPRSDVKYKSLFLENIFCTKN